jgi:hypothetical protein
MKHIEIFTNSSRIDKTTDISKVIPFEFIDSSENTVLDLDIQQNGGEFKLYSPISDGYGREIQIVNLPPIKAMAKENSWILDNLQMRFNTLMKVHNDYLNNRCDFNRVKKAVTSYIEKGLANSIWGKRGFFRNICVAFRAPHSVRAVALPNADYGIDEIGIPRSVMNASGRKHGNYILITRFPAIWDGSIEVLKARTSNNDCIEIHPLLHSQFNLDHDGDTLTGYWIPNESNCIKEAEESLLQFFKGNPINWPAELCMNGYPGDSYSTDNIDSLKTETKQRLIPDGFSIDPKSLLTQEHNLDHIMDKDYQEDIAAIAKDISRKNFYDRSIDINIKNLTMKMFMGPVGIISNDVKLVGSDGPEHIKRSAMYISEAIQQSLMDSKHEVGSPNNMRFMKIRNAIAGTSPECYTDITRICKCIEENGLSLDKSTPFIIYAYILKPLKATLDTVYIKFNSSTHEIIKINSYYNTLINQNIPLLEYKEMLRSIRNMVSDKTECSATVFQELFKSNVKSLNDYILDNFPVYSLISKSSILDNRNKANDLCTRIFVNKESDIYGSCSDEFAKFGD